MTQLRFKHGSLTLQADVCDILCYKPTQDIIAKIAMKVDDYYGKVKRSLDKRHT